MSTQNTMTPEGATPPNIDAMHLLGTLAAGMAHDLRNVLNGMFLRVQLLERTKNPDVALFAAHLRDDILVGVQLLDRVRELTAADKQTSPVDLNDVATEACELARLGAQATAMPPATIRSDPGAVRAVTGRRGEIVSAVLNLLLNARRYPGGLYHRAHRLDGGDGLD